MILPFACGISNRDFMSCQKALGEILLKIGISGLVLHCSEFYRGKSILPNF